MLDLLKLFIPDPQAGTSLVLAIIVFYFVQNYLTNKQTKVIGSNHMQHLREDIKEIIGQHERTENQQMTQMIEALGRIERILIEIKSQK